MCRHSRRPPARPSLRALYEEDPVYLWRRHRIVPFAPLLHVVLVVLVTTTVYLTNHTNATYVMEQRRAFVNMLFPGDYGNYVGNSLTWPGDEYWEVHASQFRRDLTAMFSNYFQQSGHAVGFVRACGTEAGTTVGCPRLSYATDLGGGGDLEFQSLDAFMAFYNTTILSHDEGDFAQHLTALNTQFPFVTNNLNALWLASRSCAKWTMEVTYDFSSHASVRVFPMYSLSACVKGWSTLSPLVFLGFGVLLLSALHQLAIFGVLYRSICIVRRIKLRRSLVSGAMFPSGFRFSNNLRARIMYITTASGNRKSSIRTHDDNTHGAPLQPPDAAPGNPSRRKSRSASQLSQVSTTSKSSKRSRHHGGDNDDGLAPANRGRAGSFHGWAKWFAQRGADDGEPMDLDLDGFGDDPDTAADTEVVMRRLMITTPYMALLGLFDKWAAVASLGNACNIGYCLLSLSLGELAVNRNGKLLFACGAALTWITLSQYLKYNAHYFVLARTLRRGLPQLARFAGGTLPIYMAFLVFGVAVFGSYATRFDGTGQAAITLFAIMNGDVMRETFLMSGTNQTGGYVYLSQAYCYLFLFCFIYVACMITIAVIEEAFVKAHPFVIADTDGGAEARDPSEAKHRLPFHLSVALDALDELDVAIKPSKNSPAHGDVQLTGFCP